MQDLGKSDDIETKLRELIANHILLPGTKLKETALAEDFGVSRSRVRQAFANLEQRGLVERVHNYGTRVAVPDARQIFAIYDVFELLEGLCVRLAVQNSQNDKWDDLHELFGPELRDNVEGGDCEALFNAIMTYRRRTQVAADNATLNDFLESIYDKTQMIIRRTLVLPGRAELSYREHASIVAAMREGDAEKAEMLKRANMRTAREFLERYETFIF